VAVVEDDPSTRRSLDRLLSAAGFATEAYASAEAFLEAAAERRSDCLVLDIHLLGMSGIELRRRLVASGANIPVIFITAVDEDALECEALRAGCVAYLHKPFPAQHLVGAIKRALSDSPAIERTSEE